MQPGNRRGTGPVLGLGRSGGVLLRVVVLAVGLLGFGLPRAAAITASGGSPVPTGLSEPWDQQDTDALLQPAPLSERHSRWLEEEVVYIIAPIERAAFEQFGSDEARDNFIEAFWRSRDPTPGTAANEVREEHYRRIAHAKRYLGRETPRAGWQTDRGRIYIQLGEPGDIQSYADPKSFWPIELWFYRTNPRATGLPPFFYVMFFRPTSGAEFDLYDPLTHGPGELAKSIELQMADTREIVQRLLVTVGHEVALASINLNPNEPTSLNRPYPSPGNALILRGIEEAPLKGVDVSYARAFAANRGEVAASVAYARLPLDVTAVALWDERGMPFLHYALQIPPERVLLGQYERDYYFSLAVDLTVSDLRGARVDSDTIALEAHFDEERAQALIRAPFAYYDRFDLVPGVYDLAIGLRNEVTGDSSVAETRINVPAASGESSLLSDLLVAIRATPLTATTRRQGLTAFRFGNEQFVPAVGGRLFAGGTAELLAQLMAAADLGPDVEARATVSLITADGVEEPVIYGPATPLNPYPHPTLLRAAVPLEGVRPGSYRLRLVVNLSNGTTLIRERQVEVLVVRAAQPPEIILADESSAEDSDEYRTRGRQHLRKGELVAAAAYFRAALEEEPGDPALRRVLARALVDTGEYAEAVFIIRPLASGPAAMLPDQLLLSSALLQLGDAAQAAAAARQALERWRPTAPAYNVLAEALLRTGDTAAAIEAFRASLAIDPDQPAVREKLGGLIG